MQHPMDEAAAFKARLRTELDAAGLLGEPAARAACASEARALGERACVEIEALVGARTMRRALAVRRGARYAESYRYVAGYGALMTRFVIAPLALEAQRQRELMRLGAIANIIVSYFDEMVDGGWPRALLLPRWALAFAASGGGRLVLRGAARCVPPPTRLTLCLVAEFFAAVVRLPHAARRAAVRSDLRRTIVDMYLEEGRTPREWQRIRGAAARQKKTALPLVVLGLPGWLARAEFSAASYRCHRRWLVRLGKFVRWIDDAADMAQDRVAGSANLAVRAFARAGTRCTSAQALAGMMVRRGRWLLDEWSAQRAAAGAGEESSSVVLATVLAAWLDVHDEDSSAAA
jgi:hypothetical protein